MPEDEISLPPEVAAQVRALQTQAQEAAASDPPPEVLALVEKRETARSRSEWATADALRARIAAAGWHISDTPDGPQLESLSGEAP
jgi:cysteinyl-tRNA synthetase